MATRISLNRRRSRSTSAPSSPLPLGSPDDAWRFGTKRAHPLSPGYTASPCKWENVEMWRRGKRARRDISPTTNNLDKQPFGSLRHSISLAIDSSPASTAPTPFFAATSAEFNLFPKQKRARSNSRRSHPQSDPPLPSIEHIDLNTKTDLTRLRSDAFWELRRSIAESGEGLVRRMRDYESSRSRGAAYSRAKDSLRRGRKRHSLSLRPRRVIDAGDGSDEEDDVQIFSGEGSSEAGDYNGTRKKRAFSLGTADSGVHPSPFMDLDGSERGSSSGAFFSAPSAYNSDDESMDLVDDSPLSTSIIASSPGAPTLSHSFTNSTNSSFVSLPGPLFGAHSTSSPPRHHPFRPTSPSSSRSEKAIAALSLAMANGAGGLNDYGALRVMETPPIIEDSLVGELWH